MHSSMNRLSALYKTTVISIFCITGLLLCFISIKAIAAPADLDIPAQPLSNSLKLLAKATGASVAFDSKVTEGITAPAIKGHMDSYEAIHKLLEGTGLEATTEGTTTLIKRSFGEVKESNAIDLHLQDVNVRAKRLTDISPLPGLSLTKEEIPGNVQTITAQQIKDSHSVSLSDLMNSQLQSVNVNDYQSNPFQMDVTYRGFTASPQLGTAQGLSVFLDGIRVNEPFGDVVNWDLIPMNALSALDVIPGSNPIFGLGTLGGALTMKTKNGFDNPGVEADVLTGAFGRKQFQLSAGGSHGDVAGFVALNLFDEDGWRQDSPSKVNQIFSKLSYRNDALSLDGSMLYANTNLIGNGVVPIEMYNQNATSIFSGPDQTKNDLLQFQIAAAFDVSDQFSITGQIYNRRSDRNMKTGDIDQDFVSDHGYATNKPANGTAVCAYASTNQYHIPDYYLVNDAFDPHGSGVPATIFYNSYADAITAGVIDANALNPSLPSAYAAGAAAVEANMFNGKSSTDPGIGSALLPYEDTTPNLNGIYSAFYQGGAGSTPLQTISNYFTDANGVVHYIIPAAPINAATCMPAPQLQVQDANGNPIFRNGAFGAINGFLQTGYVAGTPVAVITSTAINQQVQGGALQLNWNLDKHKLMVGSSLDHAKDTYTSSQMLGLFDANRNAYIDPAGIGYEYNAGVVPLVNNNFSGSSDTKSVYLSETFSPQENLHFAFGSRYNYTTVTSKMDARPKSALNGINDYQASYMDYLICAGSGLSSCDQYLLNNPDTYDDSLTPAKSESFNYHSLNPSIGATWSPQPKLNLYANWDQGTRTPSTIELGCAYDPTLPTVSNLTNITAQNPYINSSSCTLPSSLSGDPYLKQVTARTFEAGARGRLNNGWEWNASAYRSNLDNDIYFINYTPTQSFFNNIGSTRRQGIEMGLSGKADKLDFKVNYSLTDARFESTNTILDSSNITADPTSNTINIHPGNVMPGVPTNNLNLNLGYQITDKWHIGLTGIAHSSAYERGNENNQAHPGTIAYQGTVIDPNNGPQPVTLYKTFTTSGKTPGYAVLNFKSSYDFGHGWTGTLIVNNLLDKFYYSAGNLGANPFSPSTNGAIGVSGWNYNSNEWRYTDMIAPGAPRAAWVSISYDFDMDKK